MIFVFLNCSFCFCFVLAHKKRSKSLVSPAKIPSISFLSQLKLSSVRTQGIHKGKRHTNRDKMECLLELNSCRGRFDVQKKMYGERVQIKTRGKNRKNRPKQSGKSLNDIEIFFLQNWAKVRGIFLMHYKTK